MAAEATFHLARAYQTGSAVERNITKAREMYKLAIREAPFFRYAAAPWLVRTRQSVRAQSKIRQMSATAEFGNLFSPPRELSPSSMLHMLLYGSGLSSLIGDVSHGYTPPAFATSKWAGMVRLVLAMQALIFLRLEIIRWALFRKLGGISRASRLVTSPLRRISRIDLPFIVSVGVGMAAAFWFNRRQRLRQNLPPAVR